MGKITLKPKQLTALHQIQTEKAQLSKVFQELNNKESLLLELIFESNDVVGKIGSVSLDKDELVYELVPVKSEAKKKKEKKTTESGQ